MVYKKLINNKIINNEYDLNKIPVNLFLEEYNLSSLLNLCNYKKELLFELYNPDLNKDFFNINYSTDNIRLKSKEELLIHEYLISKYNNVLYCNNSNKNKWYNLKYDECYIPDWIIDNNIIIEYFGFLNKNSSTDRFIKYEKKTKRKIEFFSNIPDFTFIDLYKEDLFNNLTGVKNKLSILLN